MLGTGGTRERDGGAEILCTAPVLRSLRIGELAMPPSMWRMRRPPKRAFARVCESRGFPLREQRASAKRWAIAGGPARDPAGYVDLHRVYRDDANRRRGGRLEKEHL